MEELYEVQQDEDKKAKLEDISCAFGSLLHSTRVKTSGQNEYIVTAVSVLNLV